MIKNHCFFNIFHHHPRLRERVQSQGQAEGEGVHERGHGV